jgi:hypothetical protein
MLIYLYLDLFYEPEAGSATPGELEDEEEILPDEFVEMDDEEIESISVSQSSVLTATAKSPSHKYGGPGKARSALPVWISDHYCTLKMLLDKEMKEIGKPCCYCQGPFLILGKGPLFATQNIMQLQPKMFYEPSFFVWLLHLFVAHIPCPACLEAKQEKSKGVPFALNLHGWANASRRIVDVDLSIWLIGKRYHCSNTKCGKTYQAWSKAVLGVLPSWLQSKFPILHIVVVSLMGW